MYSKVLDLKVATTLGILLFTGVATWAEEPPKAEPANSAPSEQQNKAEGDTKSTSDEKATSKDEKTTSNKETESTNKATESTEPKKASVKEALSIIAMIEHSKYNFGKNPDEFMKFFEAAKRMTSNAKYIPKGTKDVILESLINYHKGPYKKRANQAIAYLEAIVKKG